MLPSDHSVQGAAVDGTGKPPLGDTAFKVSSPGQVGGAAPTEAG